MSDEQQRKRPGFARPEGSGRAANFFVTPPRRTLRVRLRRRAAKLTYAVASTSFDEMREGGDERHGSQAAGAKLRGREENNPDRHLRPLSAC